MGRAEEIFQRIKTEQEAAIDWFIEERETEGLFLDFKASANNGESEHLDAGDKKNYAKAISGFGNSEGGVIVWGVDCNKDTDGADVAKAKKPIINPKRFEGNLNILTSGRTIPQHNKVENFSFHSSTGSDTGFVVTYVPRWDYGALQALPMKDFYVRIGSNFEKASYSYLAAQFGKRPQPVLTLVCRNPRGRLFDHQTIELIVDLCFLNEGATVIRNTHLLLDTKDVLGKQSSILFPGLKRELWDTMAQVAGYRSIVATERNKLAPKAEMPVVAIKLLISGQIDRGFRMELTFGGEGGEISTMTFEKPKEFFTQLKSSTLGRYDIENMDKEHFDELCRDCSQLLGSAAIELFTPLNP